MYFLKRSDACIEVNNPESIPRLIESLLGDNRTCFTVEKLPREYLSVVFTHRGCCVVYIRHDPTYVAFDASTESANSMERVTLMVDNEPTPIPANMKLTERQTLEIIKEFCISGNLSEIVHWLKEGPAPSA